MLQQAVEEVPGGVTLQIIRDWVLKFNADGLAGLVDRKAVLLLDQAGWHLSDHLLVPPNITLLPLPPKCPELNPVENVWQFLRDNWLSNRILRSYDGIVDHCCDAWNRLVDQPWRIISIGLRDWAHRF